MHWGSQFMNSAGANAVACDAIDPYSMQPELKHAAVQIAKVDLPYPLAIVRRCASRSEALVMMQEARSKMAAFPYATIGLYGRSSPLVVFRAAAESAVDAAQIAELDRLFALDSDDGAIVYEDARRHIAKKAIAREGRLLGVRLAGETLAQSWLKQAMAAGANLSGLQDKLKCGTFCGSCLPDIKRLVAEYDTQQAAAA